MATSSSGDSYSVLLLLLSSLLSLVYGELVDIKPFYNLIIEHHNDLRRNVVPSASDMRTMMWDDQLARYAEVWSGHCRYERPPQQSHPNIGSNLFYTRGYTSSWYSIRTSVQRSLHAWTRERDFFKYDMDCGMACSYVQMVYSATYRMGCAMRNCPHLAVRNDSEAQTTLFVCFYSPKGKPMGTYPYRTGSPCSSCPVGTQCSEDLSEYKAPRTAALTAPRTAVISNPASQDALTDQEEYFMLLLHNRLRGDENLQSLVWDAELELWAKWVINCNVDYPGPRYAYTNFYQVQPTMQVYSVVYDWRQEGRDTSIRLEKGCRTPSDMKPCNHYTNMMEAQLTSMACAAKMCSKMREVVCIYDSSTERG
ncbi:cysteine-rich secretory protein LCCL domain-containing 2-like [Pomacea canaliculata]|uniref:cysteine-rich secretory protein LCCL domain-containing 2-like n=1 Tax=Pomacea canaliculata TaxID=400727 RepID=UPI000D737966|nr:cysteine-rich secretory protein LCCL domain-containing 2-like [Pomacea canaliculata]